MTSDPAAAAMATLLRVRHARARIALATLGAAGSRTRDAAERAAGHRAALAGHELVGQDFAAQAHRRAWLSTAAGEAARHLGLVSADETVALAAYQEQRAGELVIEKLLERVAAERSAAVAHADQVVMDELAVARHTRAARRAHRGPTSPSGTHDQEPA